MHEEERSLDVDTEIFIKRLLVQLRKRHVAEYPRIEYQDVDVAVMRLGSLEERLCGVGCRDIRLDCVRGVGACAVELVDEVVCGRFAGCVVDYDGGTVCDETAGDGGTDAASATCDDGDLACEGT